jgi:hypothetical protein
MVKRHVRGGNPAELKRAMHLVVQVVVRFLLATGLASVLGEVS